jgi:hypothetical protein
MRTRSDSSLAATHVVEIVDMGSSKFHRVRAGLSIAFFFAISPFNKAEKGRQHICWRPTRRKNQLFSSIPITSKGLLPTFSGSCSTASNRGRVSCRIQHEFAK